MAEPMQGPRWARLRLQHRHTYPVYYGGQWFRVVERHHPDLPALPDHIWLELAGGSQQVNATDFDIAQRTKRRILVVDDEVSIRQALHVALTKAGHEVLQARDGDDGIQLWRDQGPDLIITDIHMPNKSGLLLLQELQESRASTRVIAMTDGGVAQNLSLLGLAELLGAVRKVAKPFSIETMVAAVEQELGREGLI
jgi:CheY-like chemotaxis protein